MSDFAHRLPLDQIRDGDRIDLGADDEERASVVERLALLSLDRLEAHAALSRDGQRVRATGRLKASLEQSCVATGDAVPAHIDEPFELLFVPEPTAGRADEENGRRTQPHEGTRRAEGRVDQADPGGQACYAVASGGGNLGARQQAAELGQLRRER